MPLTWKVLIGDVREQLALLPSASVQCCVTSPPYWGLRDYGHAGQIGLEATPDAFVAALVAVFGDVRRVLAGDGVLWLNLGDSYAGSGKGPSNEGLKQRTNAGSLVTNHRNPAQFGDGQAPTQWLSVPAGLKQKDLVGIPWRVAFALQANGWYLRSDIIWHKPNPMPESVTDRPTKAHEYIFLLVKSERYYYDAAAIAEPHSMTSNSARSDAGGTTARSKGIAGPKGQVHRDRNDSGATARGCSYPESGRNKRTVWTIATQPYPDAHFATFPEAIPECCIKAGSRVGDTVLDPFTGSGTTGQVALQLGRSFVGIELNPKYAELARTRIGGAAPLFSSEVA